MNLSIIRFMNIKITNTPLNHWKQTVEEIKRLSTNYYTDLLEPNKFNFDFINAKPKQAYEFIKDVLIYVPDPEGIEHVSRPRISLKYANSNKNHPLDCDDKTVLMVSYYLLQNKLISNDISKPYKIKIIVSGRGKQVHHVYPKLELNGESFLMDATYPKNIFNQTLFPEKIKYEFKLI